MKSVTIFLPLFLIYFSAPSILFATSADTKLETTKKDTIESQKNTLVKPTAIEHPRAQKANISSVTKAVTESRRLVLELNNPALIISTLAVLFTIFSFWWLNWRRGRLIVGPPRSFAACSSGENGNIIIQLPLVFYNNGAAAHVVQNLRLTLEQGDKKSAILYFNNTLSSLASNDNREWARQFAVEGRKSYSSIFVFQRRPGGFVFAPEKCKAILEAKLNKCEKWQTLLRFDLQTPEGKIQTLNSNTIIPYDNDPDRANENG